MEVEQCGISTSCVSPALGKIYKSQVKNVRLEMTSK